MIYLLWTLAWFCASILAATAWAALSRYADHRRAARAATIAAHPAGGRDAADLDVLLWEREVQR
jgi:hypothetical protein